ncbi:MAG: macro domain-containing protein, partial [Pseudomonadota bacterium]
EREFKEAVRRELDLVHSVETLSSVVKPFGPRRLYTRGELIRVRAAERTAYVFALASLNAHRTAELSTQEYMDSLPIVWNSLRTKGDLGSVNCPLIGAGFSRLNLTKEMILTQIVRSFVAASREGKLLESLTIYIGRSDFEDGRLTLEGVSRILDFECNYNVDLDLGANSPGIDASQAAI